MGAKLKYEYRTCSDEKTLRLVNCLIGYHQELIKTRRDFCDFRQSSKNRLRQVSQVVESLKNELKIKDEKIKVSEMELQDKCDFINDLKNEIVELEDKSDRMRSLQ